MILISACLAGINCKYNGGNSQIDHIRKMLLEGKAIPVCPEQLGGCSTPRPQVEIIAGNGADVLDGKCKALGKNGEDVTKEFIKGAEEVLKIAKLSGAKMAILKARSPSCGKGRIYDGTFSGGLVDGNGVTAELLIRNGIAVISEEDLQK